jgi:hypothetical protein
LQQLLAITPAEARCVKAQYLDSAGFFLSACNGLIFHVSAPTARQIAFWDRAIIPLSRSLTRSFIDLLFVVPSVYGGVVTRSYVGPFANIERESLIPFEEALWGTSNL